MATYFMQTETIGFALWQETDFDLAQQLWGDPAVTRLIDARGILTPEQVKEKLMVEIERFRQYKVQYWPIFLLHNNEFVGCCGLRPYQDEQDVYEIGVHLRKKFWGQGLAYEASQAVISYAFTSLGAKALFAGHNPQNKASQKVLTRLGFKYSHDEFYPPTGLMHPSYILKSAKKG